MVLNLACMLATVLVVAIDMLYNYYKVIRYTLGAWLYNRYCTKTFMHSHRV